MTPGYKLPRGGTQSAGGIWLWGIGTEIAVLIFAPWAATQYLAWRFQYHPHLGTPLLTTRIGNLYYPWDLLMWWWQWRKLTGTEAWWGHVLWIISIAHIAPLLSFGLIVRRAWQFGGKSDLHGSARWATAEEIERMGIL